MERKREESEVAGSGSGALLLAEAPAPRDQDPPLPPLPPLHYCDPLPRPLPIEVPEQPLVRRRRALGPVLRADGDTLRCERGDAVRDLGIAEYEWADTRFSGLGAADQRALERTIFVSPAMFAALVSTPPNPPAAEPRAQDIGVDAEGDEDGVSGGRGMDGPITSWAAAVRVLGISDDKLLRRRRAWGILAQEAYFIDPEAVRRWYRRAGRIDEGLQRPAPTGPRRRTGPVAQTTGGSTLADLRRRKK